MGIFFTPRQAVLPTISSAIREALMVDPTNIDIDKVAAHKTIQLSQALALSSAFNVWRFVGAIVIACVLLSGAIWTGQHNLADISKELMNSFSGFSGIILGLLGGEAQKSSA